MNVRKFLFLVLVTCLGVSGLAHAQPTGKFLTCSSARDGTLPDLVVLTAAAGLTAPGDSVNWISVSNTLTSMDVQYRLTAGTGTWTLEQSLDGGTSFDPVGAGVTASDIVTITRPIGHYKVNASVCTGCTLIAQVRCGASEGGRP